jgi:hypothetical protein
MVLGLFSMLAFAGSARPAQAARCATDLGNCYREAGRIDGFWMRWAAGIDCELDFVECVRIKVVGS